MAHPDSKLCGADERTSYVRQERTQRCESLTQLRVAAAGCRECPLGARATQTVWGAGPVGARVMLVGEQPGDREDLSGQPFVGPAGRLLDKAIDELGLTREALYLTNAVKHFKFEMRGKRRMHKTPGQLELLACNHWLESEIETVRPELLVALGATAARALLGSPVAVTKVRGQILSRSDGRPVLVTLHPSALLRTPPDGRDEAWRDWLNDLRACRLPSCGIPSQLEKSMPQGDKSSYTDKQKRQAEHIEKGYEHRGVSKGEAERRAWATVNKETGGGKKAGSGRGKAENHEPSRKGGRAGAASSAGRTAAERSASAKKAAATRKRNAAAHSPSHH